MSTHAVDLTGQFDAFVSQLVSSGRFQDAGEVMRAGLRLLQQQEQEEEKKLPALRAIAAEAFGQLDRGEGIVIEGDEQLAEFIREAGRKAAERVKCGADGL